MKNLLVFAISVVVILVSIATFVFKTDPLCYYRCQKIDLEQASQNVYYQGAQIAKAHPDAKILVLGSSRGQTIPPLWIQEVTGDKALNLSLGGADLLLKLILVKVAQDAGAPIKKIIWMADYFEFIPENTDAKVLNTLAFKPYLPEAERKNSTLLQSAKFLIAHNSFEASLAALKKRSSIDLRRQGAGDGIDYKACAASDFKGSTDPLLLKKEVDLLFESYKSSIFKYTQSDRYWDYFEEQLIKWSEQGIEVDIVVAPYHPDFMKRMKKEIPEVYSAQLTWIKKLQGLNLPAVKVKNFIDGIPGGDSSPIYWNDGVHFTCKGSMEILDSVIKNN